MWIVMSQNKGKIFTWIVEFIFYALTDVFYIQSLAIHQIHLEIYHRLVLVYILDR